MILFLNPTTPETAPEAVALLIHETNGKRRRVLSIDEASGTITLAHPVKGPVTVAYDEAKVSALGWRLIQEPELAEEIQKVSKQPPPPAGRRKGRAGPTKTNIDIETLTQDELAELEAESQRCSRYPNDPQDN